MTSYKNLGGDSNVVGYQIGIDSITVFLVGLVLLHTYIIMLEPENQMLIE
jgi:hypothetical protein